MMTDAEASNTQTAARSSGTSGSRGSHVAPEYVVERILRMRSRPFSSQTATVGVFSLVVKSPRRAMEIAHEVANASASL